MRAVIDRSKCIVTGLCEVTAPDVFELDDDGDLQVLVDPLDAHLVEQAREAAKACPARALAVLD